MVAPYALSGSYGQPMLPEVDKPILPDVFHIDDLLDFSNEDIAGPIVGGPSSSSLLQLSGVTVESSSVVTAAETSMCSSLSEVKAEHITTATTTTTLEVIDDKTDLCVPCDDLAELEWLSSFVEDSFTMGVDTPELMSTCCAGYPTSSSAATPMIAKTPDPYQKSSPVSVLENSATSSELTGTDYRDYSVPGRARSKRSRTGARIWTSRILPTSSSVSSFNSMGATESYAMSFSPIVSQATSGDDNMSSGGDVVEQQDDGDEDSQSSQKRCKISTKPHHANNSSHNNTNAGTGNGNGSGNGSGNGNSNARMKKKCTQDITQPWRCMHCQTQRTPQWRTGPMGPKTLCNACGVRYKSGRLLPEYRPAGSPSYVPHKHSHSHKKVLEMRRERELRSLQLQQQQQQQQHQQQQNHHLHHGGGGVSLRDKSSAKTSLQDPPLQHQDRPKTPLGLQKPNISNLKALEPHMTLPNKPLTNNSSNNNNNTNSSLPLKTPDFQNFLGGGGGVMGGKNLENQKCFSKPIELPKLKMMKFELPKFGAGAMDISKCLMPPLGVVKGESYCVDDISRDISRGPL